MLVIIVAESTTHKWNMNLKRYKVNGGRGNHSEKSKRGGESNRNEWHRSDNTMQPGGGQCWRYCKRMAGERNRRKGIQQAAMK